MAYRFAEVISLWGSRSPKQFVMFYNTQVIPQMQLQLNLMQWSISNVYWYKEEVVVAVMFLHLEPPVCFHALWNVFFTESLIYFLSSFLFSSLQFSSFLYLILFSSSLLFSFLPFPFLLLLLFSSLLFSSLLFFFTKSVELSGQMLWYISFYWLSNSCECVCV